jgi:hypothetical protein
VNGNNKRKRRMRNLAANSQTTACLRLALSSPGEYFILDQNTGQRTFVPHLSSAQIEHPSVESAHHGPRIDMG